MCEIRCKRCGRILKNQKSIQLGYGKTCYRISQLNKPKQPEKLDMKEIKTFITSEIQKALKEFNFSKPIVQNITSGIIPIKPNNMPKFDPIEVNKRLVVKELKEQLQKGIENVLQKVGSFDEQINFVEPIGILA